MANLTESPIYEEGIFQLEKSTPPLGGAPVIDNGVPSAGHANAQALQLANRTNWLKSEINKIGHGKFKTLSDVLRKAHTGSPIIISCEGDSLTYGQDTTASGVPTQINGASQTRSTAPYPEELAESLGFAGFSGGVTVVNRGFPGDNTTQGLIRWSAAAFADLVIIMYGTNDANNYGSLGVVEIPQFRTNLCAMIDRRLAQGSAVVLLTPPNVDSVSDFNIRPYADCIKSVAQDYGILVVSAQEQLGTLSNIWTDGVHLTSLAYRELGWHLASLFTRRDGASLHVGAGSMIFASENIGFGGSRFTWVNEVDTREILQLNAGQTLCLAVYCEEKVQPIIHSTNGTSSESIIRAYNSAGLLGAVTLNHNPTYGTQQLLFATPLQRGYRVLYIRNEGTVVTYISAVEFAPLDVPAIGRRNAKKIVSLSGTHLPARAALTTPTGSWISAFAYDNRIKGFGGAIFKVKLPSAATCGVAIINQRPSNLFPPDGSMIALREGTTLRLRQYVNASSIITVNATNFFTAGVDWSGELEISMPTGNATLSGSVILYADGVQVLTIPSPVVVSGWPGLVSMGGVASTPTCESAYIYGYDKEPV